MSGFIAPEMKKAISILFIHHETKTIDAKNGKKKQHICNKN
ncbi:MAG: hypothetical protein ACI8YQ_002890 [Polaribacter sp.]|jgi:hypothetical protein